MSLKPTFDRRRGGERVKVAAAAAMTLGLGLGGVAVVTGAAAAAPGDPVPTCEVDAVIVQDVTYSFSDANMNAARQALVSLADSFVDGPFPATLGVSSFGWYAQLPTAPAATGFDVRSASGAAAFGDLIGRDTATLTPGTPANGYWFHSLGTGEFGDWSTGTNWLAGIQEGKRIADAQGSKTILFVTDGVPNVYIDPDGTEHNSVPSYLPAAAAAAGAEVASLRSQGYEVLPVFVATDRPGLQGINDPGWEGVNTATPPNVVTEAMGYLQPGWTFDQYIEVEDLEPWLRENAMVTCNPAIDLVKSHQTPVDVNANGLIDAGDTVVFVFDVANTGDLDLTEVTVTDPTLAGRGVELADAGFIGDLAIGGTAQVLSNPYTITEDDVVAGSFDNVATVVGQSPKTPVTDEDDDTVPTEYRNGITIEKSHAESDITDVNGNGVIDLGDTVVFHFTVTNTGTLGLSNVTVTDPKLAEAGVALENDGVIGNLAAGATATLRSAPYALTQADVDAGEFVNVAAVTGTPPVGPPPTDEDDDKVIPGGLPGISIEKSHAESDITDTNGNGLIDLGDQVVFTFEVTNIGGVTLTDVLVTDEKLEAAGVELADGGQLGTLAPGEVKSLQSAPYTLTQADVDAGEFVNVATVTGTPPVGPPPTDEDDDKVVPDVKPAIDLVKSHAEGDVTDVNGNGRTDTGDTVEFTFDVTNTGNTTLNDVAVTDPTLDERGVKLVDDGQLGTLAPGETKSIKSLPVTITAADVAAGGLHNVATATGTSPLGEKPSDEDDDTVKTQPAAPVTTSRGGGLAQTGVTQGAAIVAGSLLVLGVAGTVIARKRRVSVTD